MNRLPEIHVLATGGTIAGVADPEAAVRYSAAALNADALIAAVPGLDRLARIQTEQIASVGSQNMSHTIWLALAARVRALMANDKVDGVVITHGTDTLEETAYFLSLALGREKPVVLVGAMRPADALSADGPGNLARAVALAGDPRAAAYGPLVVMNDTIHRARDLQKMAASGIVAFASPNGGPAGAMHGVRAHFFGPPPADLHSAESDADPPYPAFPIHDAVTAEQLPAVAIVYAHVGMSADMIDAMAATHVGLVLAGVGEGNASDPAWTALRRAADRGVAVVRSSRCGSGAVIAQGEIDDRGWGTIAANDLNPQKARVLLMLALHVGATVAALQNIFDRY